MTARALATRLARAERVARSVAPRRGPETFVVLCGSDGHGGPLPDEGELCSFSLDGEEHLMAEADAHAFLQAEFARRGWAPVVIWVSYGQTPLPKAHR